MWLAVVAASTLAAAIGFGVLDSAAGPSVTAFVDAFAAGAILAMLAETMIPEAYEIGGPGGGPGDGARVRDRGVAVVPR